MAFIIILFFICAIIACIGFMGSYLVVKAVEPKNKPLNKTVKVFVCLAVAAGVVIYWLMSG